MLFFLKEIHRDSDVLKRHISDLTGGIKMRMTRFSVVLRDSETLFSILSDMSLQAYGTLATTVVYLNGYNNLLS
jgi:hypothetical protein